MGKVMLAMYVTLDGFISGPNGELDWLPESEDTSRDNIEILSNAKGILLGRETYSVFEAYWPAAVTSPSTYPADIPLAHLLNDLTKYVFSSTLSAVSWKNTNLVKDRAEDVVPKLKRESGGDLVIFGGAALAQSLMRVGLIDEYRLSVAPLALGKGKPLFQGIDHRSNFKLVETKTMDPGFVGLRYRPLS